MAQSSTSKADENPVHLITTVDIKMEVEVPVEYGDPEVHECVVCVSQNSESYDIFTTYTATSGTTLYFFLKKFTHSELSITPNFVKYICRTCLNLVNILEKAEIEYMKIKANFESIINKNPLFTQPPGVCIKTEPQQDAFDDSENESISVLKNRNNKRIIKEADGGERKCSEGTKQSENAINLSKEHTERVMNRTPKTEDETRDPLAVILKEDEESSTGKTQKVSGGASAQESQALKRRNEDDPLVKKLCKCQKNCTIHGGEKPYACFVCPARFNYKNVLTAHIRTHTGEKPYKCKYCDYKCNYSSHLRSHLRIHTGEKPYKCKTCQKCFNRKDTLNAHLRIHTGEKPYECNVCEARYSQISGLRAHVNAHHAQEQN